ncbi:trypsin, partial [bacterium]|nr:trypsin [bacterium]
MKHLRNGLILTMVIVLAACAPLSTTASPTAIATTADQIAKAGPQKAAEAASSSAIDTSVLATVQSTFTGIYDNVNPSVVNIQVTTQANGPLGTPSGGEGSGFVWDEQGHIVTNNHVIENASSITVIFSDGTTASAEVVGADPGSDLAVIKVDPTAATLHPVTMGNSQTIKVGDLVIAIGNPYGLSGT